MKEQQDCGAHFCMPWLCCAKDAIPADVVLLGMPANLTWDRVPSTTSSRWRRHTAARAILGNGRALTLGLAPAHVAARKASAMVAGLMIVTT